MGDRERYQNGEAKLELYPGGQLWIQLGIVGFLATHDGFEELMELMNAYRNSEEWKKYA